MQFIFSHEIADQLKWDRSFSQNNIRSKVIKEGMNMRYRVFCIMYQKRLKPQIKKLLRLISWNCYPNLSGCFQSQSCIKPLPEAWKSNDVLC